MQTTSSGTPLAQSTRWSTKSSRPSSAQCRSSKTSTSGPLVGERLEEAPPGRERLVAPVAATPRLGLEADERTQVPLDPVGVGAVGDERARRPRRSLLAAASAPSVSRIPACAFTISPSAQKRHALAVGERAALAPEDELRVAGLDRLEELEDEPALADPGDADERDELRRALATARGRALAQERRARCSRPTSGARRRWRDVDAEPRARLERLPDRDRLGLALRLDRLGARGTRSRRSRRAVRRLVDEDAVDRRRGLQPRRRVDHVARRHALARVRAAPSATSASPVVTPMRTCELAPPRRARRGSRARRAPRAPGRPRARPARRRRPSPRRR